MAVAEGLEPSHGRINSAVPYQLGYATKKLFRHKDAQKAQIEIKNCLVGEDRVELSPRVPKTRMLALHHTPK